MDPMTRALLMAAAKKRPSLWLAGGTTSNYLARSDDGISWTRAAVTGLTGNVNSLLYAGGKWLAVTAGARVYTSPDGSSWTQRLATGIAGDFATVAYANGLYVAAGTSLYTSTDGITWTSRASALDSVIALAYGNGTWVAVGFSGSQFYAATSSNGVTWTRNVSQMGSAQANAIRFYDGEFFLIIGGSTRRRSANGTSWTNITGGGASGGLPGATFNFLNGDGLWVAVGSNSGFSASGISTCEDFSAWTPRDATGLDIALLALEYHRGLWVTAGYNGTIATSVDAVTWTKQSVTSWGSASFQTVAHGYQ